MAKAARERLASLLDDSGSAGSFSAQLTVPAHFLHLDVADVGRVPLPVRAPQARKLIEVARPALFGRGTQTLADTTVRDTWEISPRKITLGGPGWATLTDSVLEHFRDELGLPPTTRLRAELHSMLVYGKGQFFLAHQDSEKDDAMVGTLVVSLPSAHTGGELVIEHGGQSKAYRASKEELTFVAFYSDCRHEITPVRSGYRVTLTGGRDLDPPNRLVYLLDHEYTQRGLSWNRLKGADTERAGLLRTAAERAGCEAVLALAEVKETWDAAGDLDGARAAAKSLAPFWNRIGSQAGLLGTALQVAAGLGAADTAAMLLQPFRVETLAAEHANELAAAAGEYGHDWTRGVIDGWFGPEHNFGTGRHEWVERLPELCVALRTARSPEAARLLAAGAWSWTDAQLRTWTTTARAEMRRPHLEMLSRPLVRLLEAADDKLRAEVVSALREYGDNVLDCLIPALRSADTLPAGARQAAGLDAVARDCAQRLAAIIARPLRDEADWSVQWTGCGCDLCGTLGTFLGSRSQRTFQWPLAKDGRRHVHSQIDAADLSVRHQTRRQGRPYTLVLTKADELFTREKDTRHKAKTDLAWLTSAWADASRGT